MIYFHSAWKAGVKQIIYFADISLRPSIIRWEQIKSPGSETRCMLRVQFCGQIVEKLKPPKMACYNQT